MSAAHPFPVEMLARFDQQASWLEALPKLLPLPGGQAYANFLLFRVICRLRHDLHVLTNELGRGTFASCPLDTRQRLAGMTARHVGDYRRALVALQSRNVRSRIFRLLIVWMSKVVDDYHDLAESFALGADPELDSLTQELSDVLQGPSKSSVRE